MLQRQSTGASLIDVLDRVLDKGIVMDAWVTLSVIGISLVTIDARIVVASVETYLREADNVARVLEPPRTYPI
jgi:gas vesicle structural protein